MPSSTKSTTGPVRIRPSPSGDFQKSQKCKIMKEVVIHQPAPSPPTSDWILYPDEVIIDKHSSLRDARSRRVKRSTETDRSDMRPPVSQDKMTIAIANAQKYMRSQNQNTQLNRSCTHLPVKVLPKSTRPRSEPESHRLPSSQRLPTPDLSDIEEDDIWSCCATSESSL